MDLQSTFASDRPVVGMVHLPPLPGAPGFAGDFEAVRRAARRDADALVTGGVDALLVENFGDAPFYPDDVPKHVVASMTAIVSDLRETVDCPIGVNVLRNDVGAALSIAAATGASFVRANVHAGSHVTDQGLVEGRAHETIRLRERLGAETAILADLDVKHAAPLASDYSVTIEELVQRARADGVIVTGPGTGRAVDRDRLRTAVERRDDRGLDVPVFVGSGVTPENVDDLLGVADGVIVGTSLKVDGVTTNPVDRDAVEALVAAART